MLVFVLTDSLASKPSSNKLHFAKDGDYFKEAQSVQVQTATDHGAVSPS